jgi:hypothetical protein
MAVSFKLKSVDTQKDIDIAVMLYDSSIFTFLRITDKVYKISSISELTDLIKNANYTALGAGANFQTLVSLLTTSTNASNKIARKLDFYNNFLLDLAHYNFNIVLINCSTTPETYLAEAFSKYDIKAIVFDPLTTTFTAQVKTFFEEKKVPICFNALSETNNPGGGINSVYETSYTETGNIGHTFNFDNMKKRTSITGNSLNYITFTVGGIKRVKRFYELDFNPTFAVPFVILPMLSDGVGCLSRSLSSYPWFTPAGFERGKMLNQTFSTDQSGIPLELVIPETPSSFTSSTNTEISTSYTKRVNSFLKITDDTGNKSIYLFSDFSGEPSDDLPIKTSISYASLLNYINFESYAILSNALFEINDEFLRANVKNRFESVLQQIKANQGLEEYRVVCDASNNTIDDINNRKLNVEVSIKPSQSINFVELSFTT